MYMTTQAALPRTSPEQQGIASAAVLKFVEALDSQIHEIHSIMLLRHGNVVAEGWWSPYQPEYPHLLFSLSKSFTSTAVGLAIAEGCFSLDDLVISFFPEDAPAEINDFLAAMQVRHLLSMSTGHADDTWAHMVARPDGDWIKGFLGVPVRHVPGTHFLYNTGATYMLSAIVQKTTGMKVIDYLQPRLFEPLGIENPTWEESPQGITAGGIGLSLKTEDIARFGQLYLQKGIWQGQQILSEAWVAEATAFQISNGDYGDGDWSQGYGYQFWQCRHGAYRGDGAFGQYCVVMPEQDAVLAITGGVDVFDMQPPLDLVWELLLPALSTESLAEDAVSHQHLTEKLANLNHPPVQGKPDSPTAAGVSGKVYRVEANELQLETIALDFVGGGMRIKRGRVEDTISYGVGVWQQGQTTLFNQLWEDEPVKIVASGAWTADDAFTMVIRLYERPFYHTVTCHFAGDEMMIETRVNASFDSTRTWLLTAHSE